MAGSILKLLHLHEIFNTCQVINREVVALVERKTHYCEYLVSTQYAILVGVILIGNVLAEFVIREMLRIEWHRGWHDSTLQGYLLRCAKK